MSASTAIRGRLLQIYRNSLLVAGARTKSLKINGSPIDVTVDDDAGVRQLLAQAGQVDVSISVSGILVSDQLIQEALSATSRTQTTSFGIAGGFIGSPDHLTFTGSFYLASFELGGEYQGAATFSAEFQSAGAVTLT